MHAVARLAFGALLPNIQVSTSLCLCIIGRRLESSAPSTYVCQ